LIENHVKQNKIVKTIESPRDLLVSDEVTQYSFSHAPHSEIKDILLLSRPDWTIYDEVRNVEDFVLFKDLRLT
jgi:ATPase